MKPLFTRTTPRRVRILCAALFCALLALLFEFLFANFSRLFIYDKGTDERSLLPYCTSEITIENDSYLLTPSQSGAGTLSFSGIPGNISTIVFDIRYTNTETRDTLPAPTVTVTATDPRTTWSGGGFITVATEDFAVGESGAFRTTTLYLSIENSKAGDLRLSFSNLKGAVELRDVRINATPALSFSFVRFLLLALLLFIPALLSVTGLFYTDYDPKNYRHRHGAKTAVLVTLLLSLFFASSLLYARSAHEYPLLNPVKNYQPYIQQFDAFMKGQLHLDVPVPDELLSVENPYDHASRVDADPLWDRAYYDGKYYSYFGITPILLVYLPYYLFTGTLPADNLVMTVFLLITAVFIPLSVLKWVDLHEKRTIPLPVVWLGAVTAFVGSMMLLIARSVTPFYYIAALSASAFLSVFLYLLLKAAEADRLRTRILFYLLAGLAFAFILHSRLNVALLAAFIVIPYLFFRVLKKRSQPSVASDTAHSELSTSAEKSNAPDVGDEPHTGLHTRPSVLLGRIRAFLAPPKEIVVSLLALGLPVLVGITALLILNQARFGSIFEFGTSYQLTVSDVRYNELSLGDLVPAIYHYFLQDLSTSAFFPFFSIDRESLSNYGHYVYIDASFGLFSLPLFRALLFFPAALFLKRRTRYEKTLLLSLLIGLITVALLNFSMGGVIFRYVADLTVLASLGAVFLCFALCSAVSNSGKQSEGDEAVTEHIPMSKKAVTVTVLLFFTAACIVSFLLSISYNGNLTKYATETFISLKEFFTPG
ncbi:MAG: hypothetical protein IKC26_05315 [Clostridia bacterium]|nr:hypothetical protein [Clostridia bacterium]